MRNKSLNLVSIVLGIILLSFSLVYFRTEFEVVHEPNQLFKFKEGYLFSLFSAFAVLIVAFTLGFLSWLLFKNKAPDRVFHFVIFNLLGLIFLLFANTYEIYKIWHYNKYQANIDYNESLTRATGVFIDTCMLIVENDIKEQGILPNDYRILSYSYDNGLAALPRDTTNKYYSVDIIYSKNVPDGKAIRAASYLINFRGRFTRVYDVAVKDKK